MRCISCLDSMPIPQSEQRVRQSQYVTIRACLMLRDGGVRIGLGYQRVRRRLRSCSCSSLNFFASAAFFWLRSLASSDCVMIPSSFELWSFAFPRLRKGLRAVGGGAFLRRNGVTSSALLERLLLPAARRSPRCESSWWRRGRAPRSGIRRSSVSSAEVRLPDRCSGSHQMMYTRSNQRR